MHSDHTMSRVCAHDRVVERWAPVEGWPGYEVSSWGGTLTYWGAGGGSQGRRGLTSTPRPLKGTVRPSGYRFVELYRDGSKGRRNVGVHVLVLEAFKGPRADGMEACHWDGNRLNNHVDNLRWGTHLENMRDNFHHGKRGYAKLSAVDIPSIWIRLVTGRESDSVIARDFNVSSGTIQAVRSGRNWSHITSGLPGRPIAFRSTLSESQVREIRELDPSGRRTKEIALAYGVDPETIRLIVRRETWKNV